MNPLLTAAQEGIQMVEEQKRTANAAQLGTLPTVVAHAVSLRGIDAGPLEDWRDLLARGKIKSSDVLVLAEDLPKIIAREGGDLLAALEQHPRWHLDCEVLKGGKPGKWRVWSLSGNQSYSTDCRTHGEGDTPAEALRAALSKAGA